MVASVAAEHFVSAGKHSGNLYCIFIFLITTDGF